MTTSTRPATSCSTPEHGARDTRSDASDTPRVSHAVRCGWSRLPKAPGGPDRRLTVPLLAVPATDVARIRDVIDRGERLPRNLTFFWPKPRDLDATA
jgi:hypothetical protein